MAMSPNKGTRRADIPRVHSSDDARLASMVDSMPHGYCERTQARATASDDSCITGDMGSWNLGAAQSSSSWTSAVQACAVKCSSCERCRVISVSASQRDCRWFATCPRLAQEVEGYRTVRVGTRSIPPPSDRLMAACPALRRALRSNSDAGVSRAPLDPALIDCWMNASLSRMDDAPLA